MTIRATPPEPTAPPTPPAGRPRRRQQVISLKGTLAWRRWVRKLADHLRTTTPGLIDRALVEIAQRNDFPVKPPRRA